VAGGEGGFQANTRVPFADGLSTFTGLLTAQNLGFSSVLPRERILSYVEQHLECRTGGFRGASWDQQLDVEYTFYGLGILGLLHS
jgi:geranylgeranyl transferase type-2 subunit beta